MCRRLRLRLGRSHISALLLSMVFKVEYLANCLGFNLGEGVLKNLDPSALMQVEQEEII